MPEWLGHLWANQSVDNNGQHNLGIVIRTGPASFLAHVKSIMDRLGQNATAYVQFPAAKTIDLKNYNGIGFPAKSLKAVPPVVGDSFLNYASKVDKKYRGLRPANYKPPTYAREILKKNCFGYGWSAKPGRPDGKTEGSDSKLTYVKFLLVWEGLQRDGTYKFVAGNLDKNSGPTAEYCKLSHDIGSPIICDGKLAYLVDVLDRNLTCSSTVYGTAVSQMVGRIKESLDKVSKDILP